MAGAIATGSGRFVSRFRRCLFGVLTLSLVVSCSRAQRPASETASTAHSSAVARAPEGTRAKGEEGHVYAEQAERKAEPLAASPLAPPPPGEKPKAAAAPSPVSGGAGLSGLSGIGQAAGGVGYGRAGGARKRAMALAPAPAPLRDAAPMAEREFNTESYAHIAENPFLSVKEQPLSTFSIDVDTASYSNSRRFLTQGSLPPKDAIRVEEWVNYFAYDYPEPSGNEPFSVNTEVTSCPWNADHRLVRIGIKGRSIAQDQVPPRNLVFLIDVSGSMSSPDKLPLVKRGLAMLADNLRPQDTIAVVVYAGSSGLVLPATSGRERGKILQALDNLEAGGSTNGGAGIQLAYGIAQQQFKKGGVNRVILASDGDFNVGTTSEGELTRLIEDKRKSGVFLTVLGFGTGNVKDSTMEMLADKGNGNYAYIDSQLEARKVLVREAGATLITIAKDVKLQVEFNPARVASYKLIGYENRMLAKEDFNDDRKDAGEIGAGHNVTALYEIVPVGAPRPLLPSVDPLKYQTPGAPSAAAASAELLTVNVRYKPPQADASQKLSFVVRDEQKPLEQASADARFSIAVANTALLLRGSKDVERSSLDSARALAAGAIGADKHGDRREFLALIDEAKRLGGGTQTVLNKVAR
jgi:Ca-activated chloride channel family protein